MFQKEKDYTFSCDDGIVTVERNDEFVETRNLGFDVSENDFKKWCDYYIENEARD